MYVDRLLPHNPEAEEAVVGSILIDEESLSKATSLIVPADFYVGKNRRCYEAQLALFERGESINQVTLAEELALQEHLDEVGGVAYLAHLVRMVPTSVHVEHYAGIVQRTSVMRQLISTADNIAAIGYEGDASADNALSKAEDLLYRIRTGQKSGDFVHIREVLDRYMEETASLEADSELSFAPVPT